MVGDYCGVSAFCDDLEGTMIGPGHGWDEEPEGNAVTSAGPKVFTTQYKLRARKRSRRGLGV